MPRHGKPLKLSPEECEALRALEKEAVGPIQIRAEIVRRLAAGATERLVAGYLYINRATVRKWRDRYLEAGIEGLVKERPRTGSRGIGDAKRRAIMQAKGVGLTIVTVAKEHGVSPATVSRVWNGR